MSSTAPSRRRAARAYRTRLAPRGLTRFEVLGRKEDRDLIREVARRLAGGDDTAARLREAVVDKVGDPSEQPGNIVEWLLRSPLVGSDLNLDREWVEERPLDL
jgi:hypothetical protein